MGGEGESVLSASSWKHTAAPCWASPNPFSTAASKSARAEEFVDLLPGEVVGVGKERVALAVVVDGLAADTGVDNGYQCGGLGWTCRAVSSCE